MRYYEFAWERAVKFSEVILESYVNDPRFTTIPVATTYDNVRDLTLNSISEKDKEFLMRYDPNYVHILSLIIISNIHDALSVQKQVKTSFPTFYVYNGDDIFNTDDDEETED